VASRIIKNAKSRDTDGEYEFYRNILKEERRYTMTRRFWE
jgi:hypothetical protein